MNKWPQKLNGVVKPHLKNRDQVFDLSSLPIRELKTDSKYWGCWWLKSPQCLSGINSFVELCNLTSQVYREQITQHSPPLQKMGYADLLKAIFFCATNFRVDDKSQITFLIKIIKTHPGWYSSVDWVLAMSPRVAGSISSQGICLPGLRARAPVGATWEATTRWCFSPSLSPSLLLSLKTNKIFLKKL